MSVSESSVSTANNSRVFADRLSAVVTAGAPATLGCSADDHCATTELWECMEVHLCNSYTHIIDLQVKQTHQKNKLSVISMSRRMYVPGNPYLIWY